MWANADKPMIQQHPSADADDDEVLAQSSSDEEDVEGNGDDADV